MSDPAERTASARKCFVHAAAALETPCHPMNAVVWAAQGMMHLGHVPGARDAARRALARPYAETSP